LVKITVLSGGTGTPKLLQGIVEVLPEENLSVIVNTGEDVEISGLHVSPDLDTVVYTLAGVVNEETWYGLREDTFRRHEELAKMGKPELLRIGDRDREIKQYRTNLLKTGKTLSQATREICKKFGVKAKVMPMTDDRIRTIVHTDSGILSFHEFWVARRARDRVLDVKFMGSDTALPAEGTVESIEKSDAVIIGPSNPITSIGPILSIRKIKSSLRKNKEKTIAVSPIIGREPVSGPAGALMSGLGYETSSLGVAEIYRDVAGLILIDRRDAELTGKIEEMGLEVHLTDLLMPDLPSRKRLAHEIILTAEKLYRSP